MMSFNTYLVFLISFCTVNAGLHEPGLLQKRAVNYGDPRVLKDLEGLVITLINETKHQTDRLNVLKLSMSGIQTAVVNITDKINQTREAMKDLKKSHIQSCKDVVKVKSRQKAILANGMEVLCDMVTAGGGWIVIQRRFNGRVNFANRPFKTYREQFGSMGGEFWFGLDRMAELTNKRQYELRIDMKFKGRKFSARYASFRVSPLDRTYMLSVGKFVGGNAGDSFSYHTSGKFTTGDHDADTWKNGSCALRFGGGWWYNDCRQCNLNGVWKSTINGTGLTWKTVTGYQDSLTRTEMKIRPTS